MSKQEKFLNEILRGTSDANIPFARKGIEEIINVQPKGAKAKPYQVKQVRHMILKYKLEV